MPRIPIPLGKAFTKGRSTAAGMQSMVNMYSEQVLLDGRTDTVCYSSPGRTAFAGLSGTIRGQITADGIHYAVSGTTLYKVNGSAAATALGTVEGVNLVDMAFNGLQLEIVSDLKTYTLNASTLDFAEINDINFATASSCASVSSYSLFSEKGSARLRWRLAGDTAFGALDYATAEAESDSIVAIRKVGNEVALLGETSVEWWGATGESGADAFARNSTAPAGIGCVSRSSALVVDDGLTWIGRDGKSGGVSVYRAEGYRPRKISTPQIDEYLEAASDPSLISAISYQQRGHLFYVITLPSEWTLALDILTGVWSYRKNGTWSMGAEPMGGWDATTFALNGSKQIIGCSDGNLWELDPDKYTDDITGSPGPLIREVTAPQISEQGKRMFMRRLELEIEAGVGVSSGQGSSPVVMESHSDDGGKTWSSPRNAGMGAVGEYKWRAVWHALGSFRQRIIKFRVSDPVPAVFLTAHADVDAGGH
jgi:hypothetical protein